MTIRGTWTGGGLCWLLSGALSAQQVPDSLPQDVTAEMIREGRAVFHSAGLCMVCHGPEGKGQAGLGPNLSDDEWLHSSGSYADIVDQIRTGVPAGQSTTGLVMPPKGGSAITDDQVRAVAAYVWSLARVDN